MGLYHLGKKVVSRRHEMVHEIFCTSHGIPLMCCWSPRPQKSAKQQSLCCFIGYWPQLQVKTMLLTALDSLATGYGSVNINKTRKFLPCLIVFIVLEYTC